MNEQDLIDLVRPRVSEKRFLHIMGVADTAQALAQRFGQSENRARQAALLHDAMRGQSDEQLMALAKAWGYEADADELARPMLMHGPLAALWAQRDLGLEDEEVLCAVRAHTLGDGEMAPLTCILYLADMIEPGRHFEGVEALREVAKTDLYRATMRALDNSVAHVIQQGEIPAKASVDAMQRLHNLIKEADSA